MNETTGEQHDLTGTSAFDVDFGRGTLAATLALRGEGADPANLGSFRFEGVLSHTTADSGLDMMSPDGLSNGTMTTRFYGPDGDEIAGPFAMSLRTGDAWTRVAGVAAARR